MSRLNASIKLLYLLGETFFILLSIITSLISGLILSGRYDAFNYDSSQRAALIVLVSSSLALFCSLCCGCCGSIRQIERKGFCAGRRILGLHQIILIALFVLCTRQYIGISRREASLSVVLSNPASYPNYDAFEKELSQYFNDAYFHRVCSTDDDADAANARTDTYWLMNWIYRKCSPLVASDQERDDICAPNRNDLLQCDTDCEDSAAPNNDDRECCPSEVLCLSGVQDACPYEQCRIDVLREVSLWMKRLLLALATVSILSLIMTALTCLLICYNPRDEIETELYKSGVLTQKDIETIQRLKEEKMFTFDTTKAKRQSIDLDDLHRQATSVQRSGAARMGAQLRAKGRKHSKVSPHPSPASGSADIEQG